MNTHTESRNFFFAASPRRPLRLAKAAIVGAIVAACVLLLWFSVPNSSVTASHAQSQPEPAPPASEFEYFPGKYKNQATEIPEHIQAF